MTEAFTEIISKILQQTMTFTAPTVAVNAFNRTQNLNYLYMSVFRPAHPYRWLGNIKKYRVTPDGEIRDVERQCGGRSDNGFFENGSQSYWSDMPTVPKPKGRRGGRTEEPGDPQDLYEPDRRSGDADRRTVRDYKDTSNLHARQPAAARGGRPRRLWRSPAGRRPRRSGRLGVR